ncbi:hypothetical protein B0H21DRAFT_756889, partial [Amylocystis lapponica]
MLRRKISSLKIPGQSPTKRLRVRWELEPDVLNYDSDDPMEVDSQVESQPDLREIKPHPLYCFPDADVELLIANLSFRVHTSILAHESPVLRELLVRDKNSSQCTVVCLCDSEVDFSALLSVLYGGIDAFLVDVGPYPFGFIASLVRMGYKYSIERILETALARLETHFTRDWDVMKSRFTGCGGSVPVVTCTPQDAVSAINLARLTGTRGHSAGDGSFETLPPDDLMHCIAGQKNLLKQKATTYLLFLETMGRSPSCGTPGVCDATLHSLREHITAMAKQISTDALRPVLPPLYERELCATCMGMIQVQDLGRASSVFSWITSQLESVESLDQFRA